MEGSLGVLYQGNRQVGGFFDWQIDIQIEQKPQKGNHKVWIMVAKKVTAISYWLTEEPKGSTFEAKFYQYMGNRLVLADKGIVEIDLPDVKTLDRKLLAPMEMQWMN